jgi:hypothetical protein
MKAVNLSPGDTNAPTRGEERETGEHYSTHGFDSGFHRDAAPADARLIRAAQQLFRRAAGITAAADGISREADI